MNREGIRRLAAEELGLPTSPYRFASTREEFEQAVKEIGMPCVVKPIMSSSGHGQSVVRTEQDIDGAWHCAQEGGRAGAGRVIVEGFVRFDYEITLLTVRHSVGTNFLESDRAHSGRWRLSRVMAAAGHESRSVSCSAGYGPQGNRCVGWLWYLRSRDVCMWR